VVAEVIAAGAWEGWGIRSPEHWVAWKCGMSTARARRIVALARGLDGLPASAAVFAHGALSEDQAAEVCRYTTPAHDQVVAELAPEMTVPQLRHTLRSLPRSEPEAEPPEPAPEPDERRRVAFGWADDGRWWLRAVLPPDEGALVQAGLEAARDAEFRVRHPDLAAGDDEVARAAARDRVTWSDALCRLARAGTDAIGGGDESDRPPGERTQVLVHLDADRDLPPRLHLGPLLPRDVADHLTCDASVRAVIERAGRPLAFGRKRRIVPPILRVLIQHRDGGCRVRGCAQSRWLHVHHIIHWAAGGLTISSNLVALCPYHHRLLHRGRLHIRGDADDPDGLTFTDEHGRQLAPARASPPGQPAAEAATQLGLVPNPFRHPSGEPLDSWMIVWN
jgi:Domain of unknown function (DUF222)/HNH endonuclease